MSLDHKEQSLTNKLHDGNTAELPATSRRLGLHILTEMLKIRSKEAAERSWGTCNSRCSRLVNTGDHKFIITTSETKIKLLLINNSLTLVWPADTQWSVATDSSWKSTLSDSHFISLYCSVWTVSFLPATRRFWPTEQSSSQLLCLISHFGLHPSEDFKANYVTTLHEIHPNSKAPPDAAHKSSFFSLFLKDEPLLSFMASHIPRFFACPKKKKEGEQTATSRGVDRHFRGPGRRKLWR